MGEMLRKKRNRFCEGEGGEDLIGFQNLTNIFNRSKIIKKIKINKNKLITPGNISCTPNRISNEQK